MQMKSSCSIYRMYKQQYHLEPYLLLNCDSRIYITKLRTSNNKLAIVLGRYTNIPREERICRVCNLGKMGDEYHLFFECNNNEVLRFRNEFIPLYYRCRPNMRKFCELLSTGKSKLLENMSSFLKHVFRLL